MKTEKIKRYRMAVSRTFPKTHPRAGDKTNFPDKILRVLQDYLEYKHGRHALIDVKGKYSIDGWLDLKPKYHTIRANYPIWAKRMEEVQAGKAVIELFYWEDKPYLSKQIVFATIDKDSGCGVQKILIHSDMNCASLKTSYADNLVVGIDDIAKNDGLYIEDFKAWFRGYDLSKPMAIIHFTKFRY